MKKSNLIHFKTTAIIVSLCVFFAVGQNSYGQVTLSENMSKADSIKPTLYSLKHKILNSNQGINRMDMPQGHRALFCRFDDALDRKKIPLRMRLGTLDAVNQKEQKPGYRMKTNE